MAEIDESLILGLDDNTDNPIDYKGSTKVKKQIDLQKEQDMKNSIRRGLLNTPITTSVSDLAPIDSYWEKGETLYDLLQGQENYLAKQQGYISKFLNTFGQGAGTFATTVASSAGTLLSLPYAALNEAVNEGDQDTMGDILNNPLMKGISDINSYIQKELLPTYYTDEQRNSLLSAATGTDLVNGVGFLLSAIVPNAAITKLFGSLGKAVALSRTDKLTLALDEAVMAGRTSVEEAAKIGKLTKAIEKTGEVTGALVGRLGESAMEASDTYQQLIDQGVDEETAKSMRNNVFIGNMLLGLSDFNQATRWLHKGSSIADDIIMSGGKAAVKKKGYGEIVKDVLSNSVQEAGEEGFQYLLQSAAEKTPKGGTFVENILSSTGDLFGTVEGQKSMLLGAILGGGASAAFTQLNKKERNEYLNNLVNEVNGNPSIKDRYIINEEGKRIINPEVVNSANRFLFFEAQKNVARQNKDQEAYDLAEKLQFADLVASRKRTDTLDDFITELESLGNASVAEVKAMFGELPLNPKTGEPMTPSEISNKYVAEAKKLAKDIDNIDNVPQFRNLTPQGKNLVIQSLITQDAVKKSYQDLQQKVNDLSVSTSPLDIKILESLREKSVSLEKQYEKATSTLEKFLEEPAKVQEVVDKQEKQKEKKEEEKVDSAVKAYEKVKLIKERIEKASAKTQTPIENFKIVTPDSEEFTVGINQSGKDIIIDNNGNDVTVKFYNKYGDDFAVRHLDYDEEGDTEQDFGEEAEKVERSWQFKKSSPFTTAGRNSTKEGTFNSNGDRRNTWLSKGRQLFYEELNNTKDPLSLKLEVAPEWMYDELFVDDEGNKVQPKPSDLPVLIGYLYRKGEVVEKDGQKAYTVLHTADLESNASRFESENIEETLKDFQAFRDMVEDRFNKGQDSFVYINDISSGFINITTEFRPLKDLLSSPVIKTGGISIETSVLSNNKKTPAIVVDGKDVKYVRWSGRPYIRIKVGDTATGPVYEYKEMNTRLLTEQEIDQVILPLVIQYLEGNDTVTIDGIEATILSYKGDPSILDAFLFFGQSKYSDDTSIYFGKGPYARTLFFGKDEKGNKMSISKDKQENITALRDFLLTKKRHINKKYSSSDKKGKVSLHSRINIPTFTPQGAKMHKISYLDLIAGNGPFEAAVTINISPEGTVLNKYASFDSEIREKPNTTLKVKPRKATKKGEHGLEDQLEAEDIDLTKPINRVQYFMLSQKDRDTYNKNMVDQNNLDAEYGVPVEEFKDVLKAYNKYMLATITLMEDDPSFKGEPTSFLDFAKDFLKAEPERFKALKAMGTPTKAVFGKKPVQRVKTSRILNTSDKEIKRGALVEIDKKQYIVFNVDGTVAELYSADGKGERLKAKVDTLKSKGLYPTQLWNKHEFIIVEKGKSDYVILSTSKDSMGKSVYNNKTRISLKAKRSLIGNAKRKLAKIEKEIPWEIEETQENDLAKKIDEALNSLNPVEPSLKSEILEPEVTEPEITEQDVETKQINDDINDLFSRESQSLPYKKGDIESAKTWVQEKLGVSVEVAEGLIRIAGYDNALFGHFYNGVITLSDALEEGTEYHEAFHLVSQMYLSVAQRQSLYNEVRTNKGNKNLTDRECEEILAEDFREYVMTDGKVKYPEVKQNIFQKLLNLIKSLLGLNVETVNDVFAKINQGYYNQTKFIKRIGKSKTGLFTRTADLPKVEFTPTQHHMINEALFTFFRAFLKMNNISFYKVEVAKNIEDFENMVKSRFAQFPNSPFNQDPDWFLKHFKDNVLSDLGVDLEIKEEDATRDNGYNEQYGKVSAFVGISDKIKFLFSSIVDPTSTKTEYNLFKTIPMSEIKAHLTDMLHDKFSFKEMIETLRDVAAQKPKTTFEIKKVAIAKQILESIDTLDSNIESLLFKSEFFDAMTLAKQPVLTTLYYANGTANVIDSMEQTVRNRMKEFWATKSMMSDVIQVINGQRFISKKNAEALLSMSVADFVRTMNLEIRNDLTDANVIKLIDTFRKAFFNLPAKVIQTGNKEVPEIQGYSAFMFNLEDYIRDSADVDRKVREAISAYNNILTELMDLELPLYNSSVEAQMKNSEGETLYGYVKPSFLYQRIKNIKDGEEQTVLNKDSVLWEAIKYGQVRVVGVDGQRFAEKGEEGQHISTYTEEDMLLNRIVNLYQKNVIQFLQMADKKFVFGLELNRKELIYSPNEVDLQGEDKLIISLDANHRAITKLWEIYQNYKAYDAQDSLAYYKMYGKATDVFEEMNGGKSFETKEDFAKKVSEYLTVNYLETLAFSTEFIGINKKDEFKSVIPKRILESVTGKDLREKTQSVVAGLVLTEFVNNFEMMDVFFGSPSQYKDLFKRSPAIRANGRIASTDDFINEFIVESRKRYDMTQEQLDLLPTGNRTHHFRSIVGKDFEVASKYREEYEKALGKDAYSKVNPADAQGMVTFEFYREYSIRTGQWSTAAEEAFWKESKGENTGYPFPPLKLVHFGAEVNDNVNVYYKFSVYPLIPSMIKGRNLERLKNKLYNSGSSMYVFESGNKVGQPLEKDDFHSEIANENATHILNVADLKIQVDIAPKGDKFEQLFGTQIRKLILQNLADAGANIQNDDDIELYNEVVSDLINMEVESLADSLEISVEELKTGDLSPTAWKFLVDLFKESALEREESDNVIIGLDYLKDQSLTIDVLPTRDKIQNLMNSLINNRIQKQYMRGRPYVQASSVGFEYSSESALKEALRKGEVLEDSEFYRSHFVDGVFNNTNARLGFLTIKDEKVQSAEILLPYIFKEKFKNINQITPELLDAIGYRIPTQGLNSMVSFKVVGFLPKSSDQIAVVPYEITMQSGSDFDVDKINTFLRNYFYNKKTDTFETIKLSPEEYYQSKLEGLKKFITFLDNKISKDYEEKFGSIGQDQAIDNLLLSIFGDKSLEGEYSEDEIKEVLVEAGFGKETYDKAKAKLDRMVENPDKFLKKYKKAFLQEKLFDVIKKRLLDPERFADYINPNSADDLEAQAVEINNNQTKPYKSTANYKGVRQFFTSTNIKVAKNLWSAKLGVGQAASQAVFTSITQLNPIAQAKYSNRLYVPKELYYVDDDGDIIFGKKDNTDGRSIIDIIANQHISANVDAANKPFIFQINANGVTNDLHYYLTSIGIPVEWVSRFISQPIIIEFVRETEKRKSMLSKFRRIFFNEQNTNDDVIRKVRDKFQGGSLPSEFLTAEKDADGLHIPSSNDKDRRYTSEQLLEFIKKPGIEQLNLLDDFLFYKEWAAERRKAISSIKFDTEGAGKNLPEARISEYKYERMTGSERYMPRTLFIGIKELVHNSILRSFKENVLDLTLKLYNNTVLIEKQGNIAKAVLNDVFDILYEKSQLNSENIYKVYGMLTNIILQNNLVDREILIDPIKKESGFTKGDWWRENMLSSNSIARQVASLIRSDVMKGNYLFDNLLVVDFATKDGEPDIIKFDNTIKIDKDLENVINDAFIDLKQKNPRLYYDMIKVSFFQTGVVQSVVSFYKFIPVEDFVSVTKNLLQEPVISREEMMSELVKNMYSIKGLANKVGRNDIIEGKEGIPDYFTVKADNAKYINTNFLTKTSKKDIALYQRGYDDGKIIRFDKVKIKSNNKFNNGLVNQEFEVSSENDESLEDSESAKSESTNAWGELKTSVSQKLASMGITERLFNAATKEEQDNLIKCHGGN